MHPLAFALALAIVVYLHVVIGEMVPKNLALAGPDRAALLLAPAAGRGRPRGPARDPAAERGWPTTALRLLGVEPKDEVDLGVHRRRRSHSIVAESQARGAARGRSTGWSPARSSSPTGTPARSMVPLAELVTVTAGAHAGRRRARWWRGPGSRRFPVVDGDGELVGLPAPQGRAVRRGRATTTRRCPPAACRGAGHRRCRRTRSRTCSPRCSAPGRTWRGSSRRDQVGRRGVPRGHARGAGRRGPGRESPYAVNVRLAGGDTPQVWLRRGGR